MTNMEAYVIACAVKDSYIELTCRASRTEQKTIKKLVEQELLVGIDGGHYISSNGNKVYNKFKFNLDKAYYQHL